MRFSVFSALCAAPLVLAGALQADLVARGAVGVEASESVDSFYGVSGKWKQKEPV